MKLNFVYPSRTTSVRILSKPAQVESLLKKSKALLVVDAGSPRLPGLDEDRMFELSGGEELKRWVYLEAVLRWLAEGNVDRSQPLAIVGGGALLDLGALAASLYRRGMPLVLVPTTLLSMVDATIGGKTAVDHDGPSGLLKNFAGTFYPADEVWIYPEVLSSLPVRERISGAGEVWKTLWIAGFKGSDAALLDYIRTGTVSKKLEGIIKFCIEQKIKVVKKDPLDMKRIREVLNFGHTVGHALESAAGGRLSHGEAVLWGMAVESFLLGKKGAKMQKEVLRVLSTLKIPAPNEMKLFTEAQWMGPLKADKKAKGGKIAMSLLSAPGKVVKLQMKTEEVAKAIHDFSLWFHDEEQLGLIKGV